MAEAAFWFSITLASLTCAVLLGLANGAAQNMYRHYYERAAHQCSHCTTPPPSDSPPASITHRCPSAELRAKRRAVRRKELQQRVVRRRLNLAAHRRKILAEEAEDEAAEEHGEAEKHSEAAEKARSFAPLSDAPALSFGRISSMEEEESE